MNVKERLERIKGDFTKKREGLNFDPNDMEQLPPNERKEIEEKIIRRCMQGSSSAFKYLRYVEVADLLPLENLDTSNWPNLLQSELYYNLYAKTHSNADFDKLVSSVKPDLPSYSYLIHICEDDTLDAEHKKELLSRLKELSERQTDDKYEKIYNRSFGNDDKVRDSVFGFAIGDSVGVPAEFKNREILRANPITDMIGYGTHNQPEGTWSDDTSMTIAAMDSINICGQINYDDIMYRFYEWAAGSKYTATGEFFDIGIATRKAIMNYQRGINPIMCGGTEERDNGNGSLMRILPFVLFSHANGMDFEEEKELIDTASSLTHGHEISRLGCKIYSDFIKALFEGKTPTEALNDLSTIDYDRYYSKESLQYYQRILNGSIKDLPEDAIKSSGFVVDSLEASIWSLIKSHSYEEAVLTAVNLGDDTDTIGAITGSMAGTIYGYESIPKKWKENLKSKEYLADICNEYTNTLSKYKSTKRG